MNNVHYLNIFVLFLVLLVVGILSIAFDSYSQASDSYASCLYKNKGILRELQRGVSFEEQQRLLADMCDLSQYDATSRH